MSGMDEIPTHPITQELCEALDTLLEFSVSGGRSSDFLDIECNHLVSIDEKQHSIPVQIVIARGDEAAKLKAWMQEQRKG